MYVYSVIILQRKYQCYWVYKYTHSISNTMEYRMTSQLEIAACKFIHIIIDIKQINGFKQESGSFSRNRKEILTDWSVSNVFIDRLPEDEVSKKLITKYSNTLVMSCATLPRHISKQNYYL